ncbi:hypothetical protein Rhopal_007382-T1 [Rhodotorula paludigena]|uniref:Proteophosphoglycan ppg4 n=1 Tax=Rhodotorula paludigena TaxID=86838 RepID=A0AAV5GVP3_9BASI|nr:hypothetical protein Rhopal_007382-T1 [Rhodotorula paludigena]
MPSSADDPLSSSRPSSPEPYTLSSPHLAPRPAAHAPEPGNERPPADDLDLPPPGLDETRHARREAKWPEDALLRTGEAGDEDGLLPYERDGEPVAGASTARQQRSLETADEEDDDDEDGEDDDDDLFSPSPDYSPADYTDHAPPHESAAARRERRRRARRMYGGGRHRHSRVFGAEDGEGEAAEDEEGEGEGAITVGDVGGVGEVAGLVMAGSLSPLPLLLPIACAQLGPGLFVPLLALASVLAWLGGVVIGVEGRYVGARSFPALASGVFPHRFKLHKLGEFLAAAFVLGGSIVRTALGVVAAAEVVVDLLVPERRRRDWEREIAVGVISLVWLVVPLAVPPILTALGLNSRYNPRRPSSSHYTRLSTVSTPDLALTPASPASFFTSGPSDPSPPRRPRWTALLRLPPWSIALLTWPLALLILGVRVKHLPLIAPSLSSIVETTAAKVHVPDLPSTSSGLWAYILLTFAAPLGSAHETFYYLSSLARPSSTSSARGAAGQSTASDPLDPPSALSTKREREREGRRNQYPLALLIGHGTAFVLHLGWALVGALSLSPPSSGAPFEPPTPNLLSDPRLPRADGWLILVRILVLAALLVQLEPDSRVAVGRARRAIRAVKPLPAGSGEGSERVRAVRKVGARCAVWALVGVAAWAVVGVPRLAQGGERQKKEVGGHGEGMMRTVEWALGVGIGGVGGCLVPAIAYLVLFHLRRPRAILLPSFPTSRSSISSSNGPDALLARKERQMQRRLSGRRIWTDAGVFGLLAPVGVVLVVRGTIALVKGG